MSPAIVIKRPPATTAASPKAVKNNKPVPVVSATSYGCGHIKDLLQNSQSSQTTKTYYSGATRVAFDSVRTTAQTCVKCECKFLVTRTFLCMQCPNIHCPEDAKEHSKERGHMFGIDSRSGHVYCFMCEDFIYDPTLEEIRIEREASIEGHSRKRRRIDDHKLTTDVLKYIESNTNPAPCRATGLRGFLNMGSTCFMSVVLQSLIHNPLVRNFYLSDGHNPKECTQTNCMSCAMDEVFSEFFAIDKPDGFGPVNLLTTSWKCEQTLAGYQQQDAHEYLQFLLNQLHITNGGNSDTKEDPCKCIIHKSFYGKLQSDVTCSGCANVTTAFDPVMDLSLDLRIKAKKKAVVVEGEPTMQTLQECLERFTSSEKLGVDGYNCGNCKGAQETATKQLTIKQLPPVLCIQLKRFEQSSTGSSSKIDTKIRFPMQLDMTPYTTRARRKTSTKLAPDGISKTTTRASGLYLYDLLSVVQHMGQINSGHYVSYSRENGQWFRFDDSMVTLASEKDVLGVQAYLLFYVVRNLS